MKPEKIRVIASIEDSLKEEAQRLALIRKRSLSNLIEVLIESEVNVAKESGELPSIGGGS